MGFEHVNGETPNTVNTSVTRTRRYLTGREVEKLIEAARKHGRYGHRDADLNCSESRGVARPLSPGCKCADRKHPLWQLNSPVVVKVREA
jgi:hypothetical protein